MKEIVINVETDETRIALLDNHRLMEFYIERELMENILGNIYKGRVESILPGMQAAFVDIGIEKNGFLYVTEIMPEQMENYAEMVGEEEIAGEQIEESFSSRLPIESLLKRGQEILVQVIRESFRSKGARITTVITLPGRILVLMPTIDHVGISRRIEDEQEKNRLKACLKKIKPNNMGLIVRTLGVGKKEKDFLKEMDSLLKLWEVIRKKSESKSAPSLIHKELGIVSRIIRDLFTEKVETLIIDSPKEFNGILDFIEVFAPHLKSRVKLYQRPVPIFEAYGIEAEIEQILQRRVPLPSGGYLVIDEVEALVAIDVNSGKYVGKRNLEETALKINLEAAKEIARQLRLRDMGGIIIIDFIDMEKGENRSRVLKSLEEAVKEDRARPEISQFTKLGLVEMTRKRVKQSLNLILGEVCPHCGGNGVVLSKTTIFLKILRKLSKVCATRGDKEIKIVVHPDLAVRLLQEGKIEQISQQFGKKIYLQPDENFSLSEMKIYPEL